MRSGDIAGARVPLMKAAELDQNNPKILSNLALFLLATGQTRDALGLMNQLKLAPAVRAEIRNDATRIAAAARARQRALARPGAPGAAASAGATLAASAAGSNGGAAAGTWPARGRQRPARPQRPRPRRSSRRCRSCSDSRNDRRDTEPT
ncbi:tetratricopeptide repeat family protein [Burkholderia pseudomallei MSHR1328]|nr:tetratricopeptide repeat family protein [Burkholderia pseudomallei MSHR1328]